MIMGMSLATWTLLQTNTTQVTSPNKPPIYLNMEFWVAAGTILLAVAGFLNIITSHRRTKILFIQERIKDFYLPFINLLMSPSSDAELKVQWDKVRPFIRLSSRRLFNNMYDKGLYHGIPRTEYYSGTPSDVLEYNAWKDAFAMAVKDFRDLDKEHARLRGIRGVVGLTEFKFGLNMRSSK